MLALHRIVDYCIEVELQIIASKFPQYTPSQWNGTKQERGGGGGGGGGESVS